MTKQNQVKKEKGEKMKGISEVIAIILILMIVIALAALAYTWFSGIFGQMTSTAGQNIQTTANTMNIQFVLEASACDPNIVAPVTTCDTGDLISMTIRNTGQPHFDATKTSFYIDGKPFTGAVCAAAAGCTANDLANGCAYSCTKTTVAADPKPKCTSANPAISSTMKAVIASGLEQSDTVVC